MFLTSRQVTPLLQQQNDRQEQLKACSDAFLWTNQKFDHNQLEPDLSLKPISVLSLLQHKLNV